MTTVTSSHLIAGAAARFQRLGVVTPAVDVPILEEVDQVDEEFRARVAHETRRVPTDVMSSSRREHRHLSNTDFLSTLKYTKNMHS